MKECEGREGGAQVCFGSARRATCAGGPAGAAIFVPCPVGSACHDGVCACVGDAVVICNEELKIGFKCHNGELVEVECGTP